MSKRVVLPFLSVLSVLLLSVTFTGCLPLFENWETEQATTLTTVSWFENNASVGPWFFWVAMDAFDGDPAVVNGTIVATRTATSDDVYKAQLLRFLRNDSKKYKITLKLRASKNVTVNYFFGREPYVYEQDQQNQYIRGSINVTTTEVERTLIFERKFNPGSDGFVKFALELGQATGVTLYVKPVRVEYLK